jgi:citrate lyase subunit beta/citryl-CoA lyase
MSVEVANARRSPGGLRSVLFAPGNHARRVEKALQSDADAVVLDLEDAVPIAAKEATRSLVVEAMKRSRAGFGYVRVNAFDTRWCMTDLDAIVGPWLDGVVLPKCESAAQLRAIDARIAALEHTAGVADGTLDLMPIVETARGIRASDEIAAACPRVHRLAFGGADYTNDLDLEWTAEERELDYARARLTHASRIAGIEPPIDTVVIQVKDTARFLASAHNGRRMGFQGKLLIHPDQIAPCHAVFTPSAAEVARAEAVVAAFEAAEASGSASIQLDGQFIDYPVVHRARRVLALAQRPKRGP